MQIAPVYQIVDNWWIIALQYDDDIINNIISVNDWRWPSNTYMELLPWGILRVFDWLILTQLWRNYSYSDSLWNRSFYEIFSKCQIYVYIQLFNTVGYMQLYWSYEALHSDHWCKRVHHHSLKCEIQKRVQVQVHWNVLESKYKYSLHF